MGQNKQAVIKGIYEPLTREEQDDLFRQMQKVLDESNGVPEDRHFMAHEHVNMHRMRATIYQMRKTIEGGETAINQLEQERDITEAVLQKFRVEAIDVLLRARDRMAARRDDETFSLSGRAEAAIEAMAYERAAYLVRNA
jgi:hypothetical protein